jgi:hypothetical protein
MSKKIIVQDNDGKHLTGSFEVKDGLVIVTASNGRTKKGDIIESMLGAETLARMLLFRLHQESRSALDS